MTAQIIDGKSIADEIKKNILQQTSDIRQKYGRLVTLAVILVGNDPASRVYVNSKEKAANSVGMNSIQYTFHESVTEKQLVDRINILNKNDNIDGILVQLPLPKHVNHRLVIRTIDPDKDVDGFNVVNVGQLSIGRITDKRGVIPCTPLGCIKLLKSIAGPNLTGLKTLVIGTSDIVGRPLSMLLLQEDCTVTIAHKKTKNLKDECLAADVIFTATGVAGLITSDMVTKNSIIIDIGINRIKSEDGKTKLVGDTDFKNLKNIVKAITPVPGGVGPMTIAYLLQNTLNLCLRKIKKLPKNEL